jgi:hypothetical protein
MGKKISRTILIQSALVLAMLSVGFCLPAEAQETTTSQNANSNVAKPKSTKQRKTARQGNPKTVKDPSVNTEPTDVTSPTENSATVETKSPTRSTKGRGHQVSTASTSGAMAQTQASEQTDLSGTYAGTFSCEDAGINGETTLTITGNQFTTSDGKTGRIVATTTSGYTAVALQLGELAVPAAGQTAATPPKIISLRARKSGDRLTLTSVPGSQPSCTFIPSRAVAGGRKSRRAPQTATSVPAATGTEVSGAAETVPATAGPTPPAPAPATRRAGRRGAKKTSTVNPDPRTSTGTPTPVQDPMPSPSPTPTGSPTASPTPSGSPTPSPSPTPTPGPDDL